MHGLITRSLLREFLNEYPVDQRVATAGRREVTVVTRATSEEKSSSFRSSSLVMSSNSEHARWILKSRIRQTPRHDEIYLSNETLLLCRNIHSFLIVRHRNVSPKPTMSLSEHVTISALWISFLLPRISMLQLLRDTFRIK